MMSAPASASPIAIAAPMPRVAPVMTAERPSRENMLGNESAIIVIVDEAAVRSRQVFQALAPCCCVYSTIVTVMFLYLFHSVTVAAIGSPADKEVEVQDSQWDRCSDFWRDVL